MTLLTRYLLRNNLFLLFSILLIGIGLYVLTDLFERLDNFIDASFGFLSILMYYGIKIPFIAGQILPAVFLIAVIVQFGLMVKTRELVALQAGGISPFAFLRFIIFYGLLWAALQLILAQVLGVEGERMALRIWREEVKGDVIEETRMHGLWFIDGAYVVHLGIANPESGTGTDLLAYQLTKDDKFLRQMVRAESFSVVNKVWKLKNVVVITPEAYGYQLMDEWTLPLTQDLSAFAAIEPGTKPSRLPIWGLRDAISSLERSGSNVEVLRTTYHSRFAYAASLVVMGVLGLAIVLWRNNVYLAVGIGLLVTFIYYACTTLFVSLGEKGLLSPIIAGWLPCAVFFSVGMLGILWHNRPGWRLFK